MDSDASRRDGIVSADAHDSITIGPAAYLTKIFGGITDDVLGLVVGDWLHEKRQQNLARLKRRTQEYLGTLDNSSVIEPSPSILLPLLRAAADEGREELQDLWAGLLSNTLTEGGRKIRRAFVEILKGMEPDEAFVLQAIYETGPQVSWPKGSIEKRREIAKKVLEISISRDGGLSHDAFSLSLQRLHTVGCIEYLKQMHTEIELSPLGKALVIACQPAKDYDPYALKNN